MRIIKTKLEAKASLLNGINKVADIVKTTYGPQGKNVIIQQGNYQTITNDGVTVAQSVILNDEVERLSANVFIDIARKTDKEVGDGRTTSIIIGQQLANDLQGGDMETYRELNQEKDDVIKKLKEKSKEIKNNKDINKIATLSSESEEIGNLIAQAYKKLGNDGVIKMQESYITELEFVKGFEIPAGLKIIQMATSGEIAEHKDVKVLTTTADITNIQQLLPLIKKVGENKIKNIVMFVNTITPEVMQLLAINKIKGVFTLQVVELDKIENKREYLEDIAILTGSAFIDNMVTQLSDVNVEHLGEANKIEITQDKTIIINNKNIDKEIKELDKERVTRLKNEIALIKVGAKSDTEKGYLLKKVKDAINSTKSAIEEGVVTGAGLTLKEISEEGDYKLINKALLAPYNQLKENGPVCTGREVSKEVLDPTKVIRVALESACSVVGILLTTDTIIAEKDEPLT